MAEIKVMKAKDMKKVSSRQKIGKVLGLTATYLFLGIMAIIVIFPFYWMISSSLKEMD